MTTEPPAPAEGDDAHSASQIVHGLLRFLRMAWHRKNVILAAVVVTALLGALYYVTATRIYESTASLLVVQSGDDSWSTSMASAPSAAQTLMPTYQQLFMRAVVLEGAIERLMKLPPEARIDLPDDRRDEWVDLLRERLSARTVRRTRFIELTYHSKDPNAAVAVINAVVESYLDFIQKNHKNVSEELIEVLSRERGQIETRLMAKEKELLAAKKRYGDYSMKEGSDVEHPVVDRVVQLSKALVEVEQRRVQLEASSAAIRTAVQRGSDLRQHLLTLEPVVGRELLLNALGFNPQDAEVNGEIQRQLIQEQAKLDALRQNYGPAHPRVVEAERTINAGRQYLANYHTRVNGRLAKLQSGQLGPMLSGLVEQELATVWQHEIKLKKEVAQAESEAVALNGRQYELEVIQHDLNMLQNLHDVLVNRIAGIDVSQNKADVRVAKVSEPTAKDEPISPKLSLVLLFCLGAGLGGGALTAWVLDVLDDRFRSPEELRDQLGAPLLAMVRHLKEREAAGIDALQVYAEPDSVESESFRTLRTALAFSGNEVGRIVVSSAEPGDGKTTVLANLGMSYAQAGRKTLMIDGDLRRPGLTGLFGMRSRSGLSDILKSDEDFVEMSAERIQSTGYDGLDILPCGPRPSDPSELLSCPRLGDLLAWAETVYDQILIDSPPVLAASDAVIIGRLVDGVMLVVQPEKNHRHRVLRAVESLTTLGVRLIGTVVNRVGGEGGRGYYGYYSSYGYGYGYGYGVNRDDDDEQSGDAGVEETTTVGDGAARTPCEDQPRQPSEIVPRRVA